MARAWPTKGITSAQINTIWMPTRLIDARAMAHGVAIMLANLGNNALARGDWSEARHYLARAFNSA